MRQLLFLPGWTRDRSSYRQLIQTAPIDVHIEIFDYSQIFVKQIDIHQAILEFIKEKQYTNFILVGHSLGGAFAIDFALKFQDQIEHLYLIDSEGVFEKASIPSQFYTMIHNHTLHGHRKLLTNYKSLLRILRRPLLHYQLAKIAYQADYLTEARQIKIPTTILWGNRDLVTTVEQAEILHQTIANSALKIFDGLDHDWLLHRPEKFWENFQG